MQRTLSPAQATILALVVLGSLGLGVVGLFLLGGPQWFTPVFHVRVALSDIRGVDVGARVYLQGKAVGEVEEIQLPTARGQPLILRLRLQEKVRPLLGNDTTVEVDQESPLTGRVLRLVPGRPEAPPLEDDQLLTGRAESAGLDNLTLTAQRLERVLGQLEGLINQVQQGRGSLGKLLHDDKLYEELTATLSEVHNAMQELRQGKGTLGQLLRSQAAYEEAVQSLQEMRRMVASVKQNADAIKSMPIVRNYVVDINKELIRPECQRHCKWFREEELFQPETALLTDAGRQHLDKAAAWMNGLKQEGSEIVVASFADPQQDADRAQILTRKQSEAVVDYLRKQHQVHRMGFWWWSNRRVVALGCGTAAPPVSGSSDLPRPRIELLVFVPQH
jgi:phospholipid/cholesterol/gamma-HCH transport system substrate-binding protein